MNDDETANEFEDVMSNYNEMMMMLMKFDDFKDKLKIKGFTTEIAIIILIKLRMCMQTKIILN